MMFCNLLSRKLTTLLLWQWLVLPLWAWGQTCSSLFPDAVSNSDVNGRITLGWFAQVYNSPDNILDTTNLNVGFFNFNCDNGPCASSGSVVDKNSYTNFTGNGPNYNLRSFARDTLSPGRYASVSTNFASTLILQPGDYVITGNFSIGSSANLEISSAGTVRIFVQNQAYFDYRAQVNTTGSDRYLQIYTGSSFSTNSEANLNAVVYSAGDFFLGWNAHLVGAVTAEDDLTLNAIATVTYDPTQISDAQSGDFCSNFVPPPNPVAEWRFDESSWNGTANEVTDEGPNNIDGRAINSAGYPATDNSNPVISGNPGTCGYGDFNGTRDGYIQIDDPGNNSALDLEQLTVALWINPRTWATSDLATILSKDTNYEFHLNRNGQIFWWWQTTSNSNPTITSSASVPLNSWSHIAITFERGEQKLYLNGSEVGSNNSTLPLLKNNDPLFIGTDLFLHNRRFNGLIDEIRLYDQPLTAAQVQAVMAETHPCAVGPVLDHFEIDVGGGTASVCEPFTVGITAIGTDGSTYSGYTGTVSLSTSTNHGDWSTTGTDSDALGSLTPGATDSGSASYTFEAGGLDEGTIELNLSNTHAETLTITIDDSSEGVSSTSSAVTFAENAFVITNSDTLGDDVIAGRTHQFSVAMRALDSDTGVCPDITVDYNVAAVKAWITRSAADPNGSAPTLINSNNSDSLALGTGESNAQTIDLNFSSGVATFSLATVDVGQLSIEFLDDGLTFSDQDIRGGSSELTVRPFGFAVTVPGNPEAQNAEGARFMNAGEDFTVTVQAKGWHSSDDTNDDGIPDFYNDSSPANNSNFSGSNLASFGRETPNESLTLTSQLQLPSSLTASDPGLGASVSGATIISNFSNGLGSTSNVYFDEVGIIVISAQLTDGSYLGASNSAASNSQSNAVGRFTPSYFAIIDQTLTPACISFSYLGQPFDLSLQIEAYSARNNATQNYQDAFAQVTDIDSALVYTAIDQAAPTELSDNLSGTSSDVWLQGVGSISSNLTLARPASPSAPFTQTELGALFTDDDGIALLNSALNLDSDNDGASDSVNVGTSDFRFGRLLFESAHGPEGADLAITLQSQYFDGSTWQTNLDDNCTSLEQTDVLFPDGTYDVSGNRTTAIGAGSTTGVFTDPSAGKIQFIAGDAGFYFTAPGAGNTGSATVQINNMAAIPWLSFDWDQDGDFGDSVLPPITASFGSYRGHDRIIYWREILQ